MRNFFRKIYRSFADYTIPDNLSSRDGLPYWREKILLYLMLTLMLFALIAYIPSMILSITEEYYFIGALDTIVYVIFIYMFFNRSLSVKFRTVAMLLSSYILGVFLLIFVGPYGAGYLWLFIVPILAATLIEHRYAYYSIAINLLTLLALGFAYYQGWINYAAAFEFSIGSWVAISTNFIFLNVIATVSIGLIIHGLESTLEKEKDISHTLEVNSRELVIAKEKAEKADSMKSEFLAQMSHEIRTPINTILSFVSLIKEESRAYETNETREYFTSIEKGSTRVIRTIDMILNMSEIQTGSFEPKMETLPLKKEIIEPLVAEFTLAASQKNLKLVFNPDSCPETNTKTDRYAATQILANLLDNAIKYTNEGLIEINLRCEKKSVFVEINDSGIGMSEEYLANLFQPFSQEESGYTRRFEGTGLGLALVKKYCDLSGASISVESYKNKGTSFIVGFARANS